MDDNKVVEYIVQKKAGSKEMLIRALLVVLALGISLVTTMFLGLYGLIFTFFAVFFAIYFYKYTSIEYEYLMLGGEMTVDVIYGRNKRKTVQKFDLKRAELITYIDSESAMFYSNATSMTTFDFTSGYADVPAENKIFMVVGYGAGNAKVFFEASDKVKEYLNYYYPTKTKF
ncbi:MAG: hypothetical protein E7266_01955 [Lachnospiraceae bacterium]|nr:hypothetical protein [Lachnospiraceae bacterium]